MCGVCGLRLEGNGARLPCARGTKRILRRRHAPAQSARRDFPDGEAGTTKDVNDRKRDRYEDCGRATTTTRNWPRTENEFFLSGDFVANMGTIHPQSASLKR